MWKGHSAYSSPVAQPIRSNSNLKGKNGHSGYLGSGALPEYGATLMLIRRPAIRRIKVRVPHHHKQSGHCVVYVRITLVRRDSWKSHSGYLTSRASPEYRGTLTLIRGTTILRIKVRVLRQHKRSGSCVVYVRITLV
jgi:hypothetical protein